MYSIVFYFLEKSNFLLKLIHIFFIYYLSEMYIMFLQRSYDIRTNKSL